MNSVELKMEQRPWGWYEVIYSSPSFWVKLLRVRPGQSLSLQYHNSRNEFWTPLNHGLQGFIGGSWIDLLVGVRYDVIAGQVHRVVNPTPFDLDFIEVANGVPTEDDIVRLEDNYGR